MMTIKHQSDIETLAALLTRAGISFEWVEACPVESCEICSERALEAA